MPYQNYSVEDFVKDEFFKSWVKAPSPESNHFWEQWLAQHPEKLSTVEEARRIILMINFKQYDISQAEIDMLWQQIQSENARPKQITTQRPKIIAFPQLYRLSRWAAVFIGILLCSFILLWVFVINSNEKYATAYGETKMITLPDGSIVTLNANSLLSFSPEWTSDKPREVWLEGEAFFEVVKQRMAPGKQAPGNAKFIVHTADVNVEVLGTEFNVNNRRKITRVTLSSGKVKLDIKALNHQESLIMKPGESVEFSSVDKKVTKEEVNPTLYTSWTNKRLIFDYTPLSEVAKIIEDVYGLQVIFEDSTQKQRKIRGTIPTEDVDILLAALSNTFNLKITKTKDQIIIRNTH